MILHGEEDADEDEKDGGEVDPARDGDGGFGCGEVGIGSDGDGGRYGFRFPCGRLVMRKFRQRRNVGKVGEIVGGGRGREVEKSTGFGGSGGSGDEDGMVAVFAADFFAEEFAVDVILAGAFFAGDFEHGGVPYI